MEATLISTACPTFFKAAIATEGYAPAGRTLARRVATLSPDDATPAEWAAEVQNLAALIPTDCWHVPDIRGVLDWFDGHMPRIMAEIPRGERRAFAEGVCSAVREHEVNVVTG